MMQKHGKTNGLHVSPGDFVFVERGAYIWHDTMPNGVDSTCVLREPLTTALVVATRSYLKEDGWDDPSDDVAWVLIVCSLGYGWVTENYVVIEGSK
jgi:hypothetical protein